MWLSSARRTTKRLQDFVLDHPIFKSPEHLAQLLLSKFVIADEVTIPIGRDFRALAGFDQSSYERQRFVYRVAMVAIALTAATSRDKRFVSVVWHLRRMVRTEMQNRWDHTDETADSAIEEATQDCTHLLFTPPGEDRGLSLSWPQEWLKRSGVDEVNPIVLFAVSQTWKQQYMSVVEFTSRADLSRA